MRLDRKPCTRVHKSQTLSTQIATSRLVLIACLPPVKQPMLGIAAPKSQLITTLVIPAYLANTPALCFPCVRYLLASCFDFNY